MSILFLLLLGTSGVNELIVLFHIFFSVLPPVLVPRQSEYVRAPPPLPAPFRAAEDPPMPYNASFPFVNRPRPSTAEQSPPNSFEISGNSLF